MGRNASARVKAEESLRVLWQEIAETQATLDALKARLPSARKLVQKLCALEMRSSDSSTSEDSGHRSRSPTPRRTDGDADPSTYTESVVVDMSASDGNGTLDFVGGDNADASLPGFGKSEAKDTSIIKIIHGNTTDANLPGVGQSDAKGSSITKVIQDDGNDANLLGVGQSDTKDSNIIKDSHADAASSGLGQSESQGNVSPTLSHDFPTRRPPDRCPRCWYIELGKAGGHKHAWGSPGCDPTAAQERRRQRLAQKK